MAEYEKGYDLGTKLEKAKCDRICKQWGELERQVLKSQGKKDSQKTPEEKKLESKYELFWEHKVLENTSESNVTDKLAEGFKKAILEKCT